MRNSKSKTIIKIKTWKCPNCGYYQDFEPTDELMLKHFGRSGALCPSCGKTNLIRETNPDKKITISIMGEEEIDTLEVESGKRDTEGRLTMRKLTPAEKTAKIKEIRETIDKFGALEDK